jgi:hypothetical protein
MAFDLELRSITGFDLALTGGGIPASEITVNESIPVPTQGVVVQTVVPVLIAETLLAPSQTVTADAIPGAVKKPLGAGGPRGAWEYIPPVFAIRTKGRQEAPPPRQASRVRTRQVASGTQIGLLPSQRAKVRYIKKVSHCYVSERGLTPMQACDIWPHRLKHVREEEERKVILMLLGFDLDEYETQLNQAEAAQVTD